MICLLVVLVCLWNELYWLLSLLVVYFNSVGYMDLILFIVILLFMFNTLFGLVYVLVGV